MSQIVNVFLEEVTFGSLHLQVCSFQSLEDFLNMCQMFFLCVTKDDNIIKIIVKGQLSNTLSIRC